MIFKTGGRRLRGVDGTDASGAVDVWGRVCQQVALSGRGTMLVTVASTFGLGFAEGGLVCAVIGVGWGALPEGLVL